MLVAFLKRETTGLRVPEENTIVTAVNRVPASLPYQSNQQSVYGHQDPTFRNIHFWLGTDKIARPKKLSREVTLAL